MEHASMATAVEGNGFRLDNHLLGLTPLLILVAALFFFIGDEEAIAAFFRQTDRAGGGLRPLVIWLTRNGNIPFYLMFAGIAFSSWRTGRKEGLRFVLAYAAVLLMLLMLTDTLKIWIGRPRPGEAGEYILLSLDRTRHSFPSNHVVETAFSLLSLAHFYARRWFTLVCGVWLAVMGFTRLYLGRHHPTDLLGSALLGSLAVYYLFWLVRADSKK